MTDESTVSVEMLVEQVKEAAGSEESRARARRKPTATFGIEDPIAWVKVFGYDANHYFSDPAFYFQQVLRQELWRWEHFPDDDAPMALDLSAWLGNYPEYTLLGLGVAFDAQGVPIIQTDHPLTRDPDLRLLQPIDFHTSGWMPRILRWYDALETISAGRLNVTFNMTWWRGCLDLAMQLRGYENLVNDMVERPGFVHGLMKFLVEQRCHWWDAYYCHFGLTPGPVNVADDWINVPFISPWMFEDFVLPRYLEIEAFHGGISSIHSCGDQTPVQKYLLQIRSLPVLEVSPWTSLERTLVNVPAEKRLAVGVHPNDVLVASPDEMEQKLRRITALCRGRDFCVSAVALIPISPHIGEFMARIKTWTRLASAVLREGGVVKTG